MTGNRDITYPSPPSITGPVHDQHSITNTLRSRDTLARRARLTRSRLCQLLDDDLQYLRHCPARFNERRVVASQSLDVGTFATLCLDVAAGYCPRSLSLSFYFTRGPNGARRLGRDAPAGTCTDYTVRRALLPTE